MIRLGKPKYARTVVQIFFFFVVGMVALGHQLAEKGISLPFLPNASLHAICPFGGVESIYNLAVTGRLVNKVHDSSVVLMVIVFVIAILFGAAFCGWICPLGSIQEWIGKLGRKIFGKKYNQIIPAKVDKYLKYSRYLVLAWIIYATATAAKLVFSDYDPFHSLFNIFSPEVALSGLIILGVSLVLSLVMERPWCRYACPYGAILGLFNKFRLFTIRRSKSTCISCRLCDKKCPIKINISDADKVGDTHCITCLECTSEAACPKADTVDLSLRFKKGGK